MVRTSGLVLFKSAYKWVKRRILFISAALSNWHFKRNILGKMIELRNQCIHLCPKKFNQGQKPIPSKEMSSEKIKCFPVSSRTRSLGSWNSNISQILFFVCCCCKVPFSAIHKCVDISSRDPKQLLRKVYLQYISGKVFKNGLHVTYKSYEHYGEKIGLGTHFNMVKGGLIYCSVMQCSILISSVLQ